MLDILSKLHSKELQKIFDNLYRNIQDANWQLDNSSSLEEQTHLHRKKEDLIEQLYAVLSLLEAISPGSLAILNSQSPQMLEEISPYPLPTLDQFVERPAEFDTLKKRLITENVPAIILHGEEGFGKTSLAEVLCRDKQIREHFSRSILWLDLGPRPHPQKLLQELIEWLTGEREIFAHLNEAALRFQQLVTKKRILLVLDNVQEAAQVAPFLQPESLCTCLIITANEEVVSQLTVQENVVAFPLYEMKAGEAGRLLVQWLPYTLVEPSQVESLAQYLGAWPIVLKLASALLRELIIRDRRSLQYAIETLKDDLKAENFPTPLTRTSQKARKRAIRLILKLSMRWLRKWRKQYLALAIFPPETDIPISTISRLWAEIVEIDYRQTQKGIRLMQRLGLFSHYDPEKQVIRLHPMVHLIISEQQSKMIALHQALLEAHRPKHSPTLFPTPVYHQYSWADLPESETYLWQHLGYHLVEAGFRKELVITAKNLRYLALKSYFCSPYDAVEDIALASEMVNKDKILRRIQIHFTAGLHLLNLAQNLREITAILYSRFLHLRSFQKRVQAIRQWLELNPPMLLPRYPLPDTLPVTFNRTLSNHSDWVTSCVLSGDEQFILSASEDHTLKLWNCATGQELFTLAGHSDRVNHCAVNHDATLIVSAGWDNTLRVWDGDKRQEKFVLKGHTGRVNACALAQEGQLILSASDDHTLKLWDGNTGKERFTLTGHTDRVVGCALSEDGRDIVSASADHTLKVWDGKTGQERLTLRGHTGSVLGCTLSSDGQLIASASTDKTLKLWDKNSGQLLRTFVGHTENVARCAISQDKQQLLSASWDNTLKLWNIENGRVLLNFTGHTDSVTDCAISRDGNLVVSASWDETVKLWDGKSGQEYHLRVDEQYAMNDCAIDMKGMQIVTASDDNTLIVWDGKIRQENFPLAGHMDRVTACAMTDDGSLIISASDDETLKVWDGVSGLERYTLSEPAGSINSCALSPDGEFFLSASQKSLKLWETQSGQQQQTFLGHEAEIRDCLISNDGQFILSASDDQTVKRWNIETGREQYSFIGHRGRVNACAIGREYNLLVTASSDHLLKVWDLKSGQERHTLIGHTASVTGCAISHDEQIIFSVSRDKTIKVWNSESGELIANFYVDGPLRRCACSASGHRISIVGDKGFYFFYFIRQ